MNMLSLARSASPLRVSGWFIWEGRKANARQRMGRRGYNKLKCSARKTAEENVDVSMFRFTLGIPGLDESQLPRIVGLLFGSLIVLNHILSGYVSPAQLRSEGVGICLSLVSVILPTLRKLELDESSSRGGSLPSNLSQVFVMAEFLNDTQKQELAWASYALIRNTKTIAIIVWSEHQLVLARGCWNLAEETSASGSLVALQKKLMASKFSDLKDSLYIPNRADEQYVDFIPKEVSSLYAVPFTESQGGLLVISEIPRAYNNIKDRRWIECMAGKLSTSLRKRRAGSKDQTSDLQ